MQLSADPQAAHTCIRRGQEGWAGEEVRLEMYLQLAGQCLDCGKIVGKGVGQQPFKSVLMCKFCVLSTLNRLASNINTNFLCPSHDDSALP